MKIALDSLRRVDPVTDGVDLLKRAIHSQDRVFCVCLAAREFHVGAADASETLRRAEKRDRLLRSVEGHGGVDDTLYVPLVAPSAKAARLRADESRVRQELDHVYQVLSSVEPSYKIGGRLKDQRPEFRERFVEAFRRLREWDLLPVTTGNAAFNHQGMLLLMEQCFTDQAGLVSYLRDPALLEVAIDALPNLDEGPLGKAFHQRLGAQALLDDDGLGLRLLDRVRVDGPLPLAALRDADTEDGVQLLRAAFRLVETGLLDSRDHILQLSTMGETVLAKVQSLLDDE